MLAEAVTGTRGAARLFPVLLLAAFGFLSQQNARGSEQSFAVDARPIAYFRIGSKETRFGPLEFVGGLEMTSRQRDFGAISSFRFLDSDGRFMGVADTGFWFFGRLLHDEKGLPASISDFSMMPMVDASGTPIREKWFTDAESIALDGDEAVVGFERNHRIARFRIEPGGMGAATAVMDFIVPTYELRSNRGFETLTRAPQDSALAGALVAGTERSMDGQGNIFAVILEGPHRGIFTIPRRDDFDITDGAFLPNGDLLLLERRFSMSTGVAMRLRRLPADTIRPGMIADGPVLLHADMGYQIDNMEALDVWERADGATMVSIMSDDNHSLLQRNLYLEFRLAEE